MKKALILGAMLLAGGVLLALSASTASAQGLHLGWNTCRGISTNTNINRAFTCDNELDEDPSTLAPLTQRMIGSYIAPVSINDFVGNEVVLDYLIAGGRGSWWNLAPGGCRDGAASFNFRNTTATPCVNWPGAAGVGGNMTIENVGADRARIKLIGAYSSGTPQALVAGTEYISFRLVISNAGTLACNAGCLSAGCIVLNSIKLGQFPDNPVPIIIGSPGPKGNHLTWQGGVGTNCPGAVPTQKSSWGQLKSLYR